MSEASQSGTDAKVRRAWLRVVMADIRAYAAKCAALAAEQAAQQTKSKKEP